MPQVGFEPTIPVFERAKIVHVLDRAAISTWTILRYFKFICCFRRVSGAAFMLCGLVIYDGLRLETLSTLTLDSDSVSFSAMHHCSCLDKSVNTNKPRDGCSHEAHRYCVLYLSTKSYLRSLNGSITLWRRQDGRSETGCVKFTSALISFASGSYLNTKEIKTC
jgi:hypothetical protein